MPTRAMIQNTTSGYKKWLNTVDALHSPNAHAPGCVLAVCATICTGTIHTMLQMRTDRHNTGTQLPGTPDGSLATETRKPVSLE